MTRRGPINCSGRRQAKADLREARLTSERRVSIVWQTMSGDPLHPESRFLAVQGKRTLQEQNEFYMSIVDSPVVTTEQLLAMHDDGIVRELFRGELKESIKTVRNRFHTYVVTRLAWLLERWRSGKHVPMFEVHTDEVGTILRRNPDTTVGIDVELFSAEVMQRQSNATSLIEGIPMLAIEVLSPSDKQEDIHPKVQEYLACGVPQMWLVDPYFQTIQIHRPGAAPRTFNREESVSCDEVFHGLDFSVANIFPPQ